MRYFVIKTIKWLSFVALTVLFFSLPVMIEKRALIEDSALKYSTADAPDFLAGEGIFFEFDPASLNTLVRGDSTSIGILTRTDSSIKFVHLYVNGVMRDVVSVCDSTRAVFRNVRLTSGLNEITAVLREQGGKPLAVRRIRIHSQNGM